MEQQDSDRPLQVFEMAELLAIAQRPIPWLIDGWLSRGENMLLAGEAHSGKTYAVLDMMLSLATRTDWHGFEVSEAAPVVWIASEGRLTMGKRVGAWLAHNRPDLAAADVPFHVLADEIVLDGKGTDVKRVAQLVDDIGAGAVVLDVLSDFVPSVDENSRDMGHAFKRVGMLSDRLGIGVVAIHHSGHEQKRPRGHSSLIGSADRGVMVEGKHKQWDPLTGKPTLTHILMNPGSGWWSKDRNTDGMPRLALELRRPDGLPAAAVTGSVEAISVTASGAPWARLIEVLEELGGEATKREVVEKVGVSRETVRKWCNAAEKAGAVEMGEPVGSTHTVRLKHPESVFDGWTLEGLLTMPMTVE